MSASPVKIWAVTAVGSILLLGGAYAGVVSPQLTVRSGNVAATDLARNTARAQNTTADQLQAKAEQLPNAIDDARELTVQFPNSFEQGAWFDLVAEAAASAGMTIETVAPGIPAPPAADAAAAAAAAAGTTTDPAATPAPVTDPLVATPVGVFPVAESAVTFNVSGPGDRVTEFLAAVEELARPLLIERLSIAGAGTVRIEMSGKTFLTRPLVVPEDIAKEYGIDDGEDAEDAADSATEDPAAATDEEKGTDAAADPNATGPDADAVIATYDAFVAAAKATDGGALCALSTKKSQAATVVMASLVKPSARTCAQAATALWQSSLEAIPDWDFGTVEGLRIDGDVATFTAAGNAQQMRRVGGRWLLDMPDDAELVLSPSS